MPFRLGTRGSPLALTQASMVARRAVRRAWLGADAVEIVPIRTTGDRVQDRALAEIGGKALWTKELDRALLAGEIDACVHSMKDVETVRPDAIAIAAMLPRADVRDRLIGAAVDRGAAARARWSAPARRAARAQLLRLRPDLRDRAVPRQCRHAAGQAGGGRGGRDAARGGGARPAGPRRCRRARSRLDVMLPAPAQGAVGIEVRADDAATRALLARDRPSPTTSRCVAAERALLAALRRRLPFAGRGAGDDRRADADAARRIARPRTAATHVTGSASGDDGDALGAALAARPARPRAATRCARLFGG